MASFPVEEVATPESPVLLFAYGNYSIKFSPLDTRHTLTRLASVLLSSAGRIPSEQRYGNLKAERVEGCIQTFSISGKRLSTNVHIAGNARPVYENQGYYLGDAGLKLFM
jgi:hypothetical protein